MKKYSGLLMVVMLLFVAVILTGCGGKKTITCTFPGDDTAQESLEAELDSDGKVVHVTGIAEFSDSKTAEQYFQNVSSNYKDKASLKGSKIIISNLEESASYKSLVGKTKEEFIEYAERVSSESVCK